MFAGVRGDFCRNGRAVFATSASFGPGVRDRGCSPPGTGSRGRDFRGRSSPGAKHERWWERNGSGIATARTVVYLGLGEPLRTPHGPGFFCIVLKGKLGLQACGKRKTSAARSCRTGPFFVTAKNHGTKLGRRGRHGGRQRIFPPPCKTDLAQLGQRRAGSDSSRGQKVTIPARWAHAGTLIRNGGLRGFVRTDRSGGTSIEGNHGEIFRQAGAMTFPTRTGLTTQRYFSDTNTLARGPGEGPHRKSKSGAKRLRERQFLEDAGVADRQGKDTCADCLLRGRTVLLGPRCVGAKGPEGQAPRLRRLRSRSTVRFSAGLRLRKALIGAILPRGRGTWRRLHGVER